LHTPARLPTAVVVALLALGVASPACEDICRNDQDCPLEKDKFKCLNNVCVVGAPAPEVGAPCVGDDASGCPGGSEHAACVEGRCVVRPLCQLLNLDAFPALTRSQDVVLETAASTSGADGCAFDLNFRFGGDVEGAVRVAQIDGAGAIQVEDGACAAALWRADVSAGALEGCATSSDAGAAIVDVVLAADGEIACFAGDTTCAPNACVPLGEGVSGGICP